MRCILTMVAVLLLATETPSLLAQSSAKLRSTKTFRCTFTQSARAIMDRDTPKVESGLEKLELTFDQIDPVKGTGRLIGNAGGADVTVISGSEKTTLLEATPNGTIQVTVIYMSQRSDGAFKSVHSRHTAAPGGVPMASQMYGSCLALL